MKAYWIRTEGDTTVLERRELAVPAPGPGQVLLKVHASSLNRGDLLATIAYHRAAAGRAAGVDAAGEIAAVGPGVEGLRTGERVIARARGSFAEYVVADAVQVAPMPTRLSWVEAASIPIVYITAYESLISLGHLVRDEWVLIAGASSGVGVAALHTAKYFGARVIGTSGSAEKLERLRALGMDHGIQARAQDYAQQVLALTQGHGVDIALDLVGGSAFASCLGALAKHGRLAIVGYVDGVLKTEIDLEAVHGKRLHVFGVSNGALTPEQRADAMRGFVRDLLPAFEAGAIVPIVDRVFTLDELPAAKAYVESNALLGKVVVTVP